MSFIPQRISVGTISSVTGTTGTGAAGRVAYWSDATTLTSSASFLFDGTSLQVPDGAVGTPSLSFSGDTDTGFYRSAANVLAVAAGGARCGAFYNGGYQAETASAAAPGISFIGDETTGFYRLGAGSIGIASGGSAIGKLGLDVSFTSPTANPLIIKALTANSNGLRFYANTATDVASIINGYNANLEIGTNNTVYQTITGAGVTTFGGNTIARKDQNATTTLQVRNDDTGASAAARVAITSDQGDFSIFANSAAGGDTVALTADSTFGGGMDISILGANALRLNTAGATRISASGAGLVTIGTAGGTEIHRINGDTGTAGAVSTYLKLNVNGTEYRVPLHATA